MKTPASYRDSDMPHLTRSLELWLRCQRQDPRVADDNDAKIDVNNYSTTSATFLCSFRSVGTLVLGIQPINF